MGPREDPDGQVGLDEISGWAGGVFSKPIGWSNRIWKLALHLHGTRTELIQPAQSLAWGRPDTISLAVIFLQGLSPHLSQLLTGAGKCL